MEGRKGVMGGGKGRKSAGGAGDAYRLVGVFGVADTAALTEFQRQAAYGSPLFGCWEDFRRWVSRMRGSARQGGAGRLEVGDD
jgi:hypothetical protein